MKLLTHVPKLDCGHYPTHDEKPGAYNGRTYSMTTGYGQDKDGRKHCYACCAKQDREHMDRTGRTTLYLAKRKTGPMSYAYYVTNWSGTLEYKCSYVRGGRHNIARTRTDAWFRDHAGREWHAVQYGENTQIAHCRALKSR